MSEDANSTKCFIYRLNDDGTGPLLLKEVFDDCGWVEHDDSIHDDSEWNLWWRTSRFRTSEYNELRPWQHINHYPKAIGICRKDILARVIKLHCALHGSCYDFIPVSFTLPNDYRRFAQVFSSSCTSRNESLYWICKPVDMSRGRGIFIIRDLCDLQYDSHCVIQRYISNPQLISGYKFDIRLYVAVVSFHPLVVYLFNDGLVRFSTAKYDLTELKNVYAHLTNTSINKYSPSFNDEKVGIGPGCKWTLTQLRHYFHQTRVGDSSVWWNIISIINLTLIAQIPEVPSASNCFELYGFDILIDENMRPWLLEVNFSPALSSGGQADDGVKRDMLASLLTLIDVNPQYKIHNPTITKRSASEFNIKFPRSAAGTRSQTANNSTCLPKLTNKDRSSRSFSAGCTDLSYYRREDASSSDEDQITPNILTCSLSNLAGTKYDNRPPHHSAKKKDARLKAALPSSSSRTVVYTPSQPRQMYSKPWRESSKHRRDYSDTRHREPIHRYKETRNRPVVGGFHLIYPFNTTTRSKVLSPRQMVVENAKMIKKMVSSAETADSIHNLNRNAKSSRRSVNDYPVELINPFPNLNYTT